MFNGAPITKDGDPIPHERRARKIVTCKFTGLLPDADTPRLLEMLQKIPLGDGVSIGRSAVKTERQIVNPLRANGNAHATFRHV